MQKQLSEVFSYREMLYSSVRKDLRSRYRGSFLGFLWTFLNPLLQLVIYSIVFPRLLKVPEENYPMYVFIGLLPWIYFSSTLSIATGSIVSNGSLVKKIYFPRLIIPLAASATGLINYLFGLVITLAALIVTRIYFSAFIFIMPVIMLVQFLFVTGLAFMLSAFYVFFRDLEHIVNIVTMAWFYLTPVVFSIKVFPENAQRIFMLNPMTQFLIAYRDVLLYKQLPDLAEMAITTAVSVILFILGIYIFSRLQRSFAEEI
ncbi:MAG: ABC transporter permease [Oscillospiraceae bacterium]|jgi:ABC-2 type transport system permease protein